MNPQQANANGHYVILWGHQEINLNLMLPRTRDRIIAGLRPNASEQAVDDAIDAIFAEWSPNGPALPWQYEPWRKRLQNARRSETSFGLSHSDQVINWRILNPADPWSRHRKAETGTERGHHRPNGARQQ